MGILSQHLQQLLLVLLLLLCSNNNAISPQSFYERGSFAKSLHQIIIHHSEHDNTNTSKHLD